DIDNGIITFVNNGPDSIDITSTQLCSRFSYTAVTAGMVTSGSLNMTSGATVSLSWATISSGAGRDLGVYSPGGSFGSPTAMIDFVQWGSAGNGRETVAVAKGIWTSADFIDLSQVTDNVLTYNGGDRDSSSGWVVVPEPSSALLLGFAGALMALTRRRA
ncbi:MAG: PEP-CTERM sorting domain-containing protein, partial [Akkermansiaceae bacterium]